MSVVVDSTVMSKHSPAPNGSGVTEAASPDSAVTQLERQVERGSFFTHTALGENHMRLNEVASFTYGLIDALMAKGVVSSAEVGEATQHVREQLIGEEPGIGVALRVEEPEATQRPPAQVDCAARMHICHAVCCKLDFALSQSEVESGEIKWDLGRPYFIRHEADGHCTHIDRKTNSCNVYAKRPAVCRGYSCAGDERIWKDFEKMQLNDEWLAENLSELRPRALRVLMNTVEAIPAAGQENQND
jgi:Fe-S-cluster containining protein